MLVAAEGPEFIPLAPELIPLAPMLKVLMGMWSCCSSAFWPACLAEMMSFQFRERLCLKSAEESD